MFYKETNLGDGKTKKIYLDGNKGWYLNGEHHREDGPAVERNNGDKEWYHTGKCHRENGPAVEYSNGTKEWHINDKLHRENGPAIEYPYGDKFWYYMGNRHRENGPAIETAYGTSEWYIHNKEYTEEVFNFIRRRRRKIMLKYWLMWTDYIMNPNTARGKRYANRQFDKMAIL